MRNVLIVGIGAGNPEHMTIQAINALNRADVLFIPQKGKAKTFLADMRRDICDRYISHPYRSIDFSVPKRSADAGYEAGVNDWHQAIAEIYERLFLEELKDGETAALLVWGDPGLYDSTIRIIERVSRMGNVAFDYDVIPGITSIQALAASHRIPLNDIGKPVQITTGRRLAQGWPDGADDIVVMLDGELAFKTVDDEDADIYWGAYLGTEREIILSGRLGEISAEIVETRAKARADNGWIMDTYLIRRRGGGRV